MDVAIPEEIYYTPKVTRGAFYSIEKDHLILISEETGGVATFEGTVIPIGIIESVEVLRRSKRPKKSDKAPFTTAHPLKTIVETMKIVVPRQEKNKVTPLRERD